MGCDPIAHAVFHFVLRRIEMAWTKPAAVDLRYGFEINLYVSAR